MKIRIFFIIQATACLVMTSVFLYGQEPSVTIDNGVISGTQVDDISVFKGIPFAAPPVGDLRWKAPQPVQDWEGVLKCTAYGPSAMQTEQKPFMVWSQEFLIPNDPMSEDCLYLNIWTHSVSSVEKKPVMVFIHGGGFNSGGAACPIYDGLEMAKKEVVFVTINYRVGVFGFLVHPELRKEAGTSGNYGILDMIAALQWVQSNIESFGGDPGNVTIAGQSAGSFAVNYLVVSPGAKGLFHKAIAQSGASFWASAFRPSLTVQQAEELGVKFSKALNAKSIENLREISAQEILKAKGGTRNPIVDGVVLEEEVMSVFKSGNQTDVPLLTGWTKEEIAFPRPADVAAYKERAKNRFRDMAEVFLELYPAETDEDVKIAQINSSRDESFGFQNYTWLKMQAETGKSASYWYYFTRELPAYSEETNYGAFHTGEMPYAFNNLKLVDRPWKTADWELAEAMSSYWVNFARTGNPNGKGLVNWESFKGDDPEVLILGENIESANHPFRSQLEFWIDYYSSLKKP